MASDALTHICDGNNNFSNNLYEILSKKEGNVFYSPLSAHTVLSLVYQGAAGTTADSLAKALHLSDTKTAAEGYQNLMEKLNAAENVKLHIANKVFVHDAYTMKEEFDSVARKQFFAEAENISFFPENQAAAKTINDWVENKTNNKIKDLIDAADLDELTRLVLVNAIYFKGNWLHQFDAEDTRKEKFYLSESETVDCDMMHLNKKFRYGEDADLDAQILNLPYKNPDLSLMIILPKSKTGINELERKLQTKSLTTLYRSLSQADIVLSLPKFKIETTMELNDPLKELGLDVMFSNDAEFPNMLASPEPLKVSKVIQKAFIEVNEEGAEAAAATGAIMMMRCAMPMRVPKVIFEVDHPFIFVLFHTKQESFPLFVGKLNKP